MKGKRGEEESWSKRGRENGAAEDKEQEKMESREGGTVILQFILEEQPLPHLSDGYQLPQDRETRGSKSRGWKTN